MRSKLVHESDGQRTFIVILDTGDEVMSSLKNISREQQLSGNVDSRMK
jgi:uncharacterized protein